MCHQSYELFLLIIYAENLKQPIRKPQTCGDTFFELISKLFGKKSGTPDCTEFFPPYP